MMDCDVYIMFGKGKFDNYCAYTVSHVEKGFMCAMPKDTYYFEGARVLGYKYGEDKVYSDVKDIADSVTKEISSKVISYIEEKASWYICDKALAYNTFLHLYYGMVAELNKAGTILGYRIKLLGLYNILKEGEAVYYAANKSRGVDWETLDNECNKRGIFIHN